MTPEEIGNAVAAGTITKAEAIAKLVGLGYEKALAEEQVFIALGGDDVVENKEQRRKNIRISRLGK